jgi:hypothetical protein
MFYLVRKLLFILFYLQTIKCYICYDKIKNYSIKYNLEKPHRKYIYTSSHFDKNVLSKKTDVELVIESPTINTRQVSASIIIDSSIDNIWSIITDYNNLSTYIPNVTQSYLIDVPDDPNKVRLFQEGSQNIAGINFRANLIMDMSELQCDDGENLQEKTLSFKLVKSHIFESFYGTWNLKYYSCIKEYDNTNKNYFYKYKTKLTFDVFIEPRGKVPITLLEWRMREDLPTNLRGIEYATTKLQSDQKEK